ncbi:MAG: 4Fe-4S binding protein [Bacillota bacterium]
MADTSVTIGGLRFSNPVFVAAGCHTRDGATMASVARKGRPGALITKTIVSQPSPDVLPCFVPVKSGFINCVVGSSLPARQWFDQEIAAAKAGGATVIANLAGFYPAQAAELAAQAVAAGADAVELPTVCSHLREILEALYPGLVVELPGIYDTGPFVETLRAVKAAVDVPVIAKLSAVFLNNTVQWAQAAAEAGADAVACADALGPALAIDIETGEPLLGGPRGVGGLTGDALKPIAMRMVLEVAQTVALPVIGVGGVNSAEDAIEYFMAGACAVGVCTAGHLRGIEAYDKIITGIERWLDQRGYGSINDVRGLTIRRINARKEQGRQCITTPRFPELDASLCNACGICVRSCVFQALVVEDVAVVDRARCYGCGLCARVCPRKAFSLAYY